MMKQTSRKSTLTEIAEARRLSEAKKMLLRLAQNPPGGNELISFFACALLSEAEIAGA